MEIARDNIWLCEDCLFAAANGDTPKSLSQEAATTAGLERLGPHLVPDYDMYTGDGFMDFGSPGCDCCSSKLACIRISYNKLNWASTQNSKPMKGPSQL